jgi:hypothetical protein
VTVSLTCNFHMVQPRSLRAGNAPSMSRLTYTQGSSKLLFEPTMGSGKWFIGSEEPLSPFWPAGPSHSVGFTALGKNSMSFCKTSLHNCTRFATLVSL